ncbi:MAG TPA: alkaline phosphatase family protein [Phycisphaerae bacterium]|nr:alkaline phosphatase family protein [Phycisphaerae bacterium]HRY68925.1 alkaline phosphatase family protein [Phycisphaerae bacterium]
MYLSRTVVGPCLGHATLFTGGMPADHGTVGNDWYDTTLGRNTDSVQDDEHPLIGQQAAPGTGFSPLSLTSSTVGDELILASGGRSRVFSASTKDRGAILLAADHGMDDVPECARASGLPAGRHNPAEFIKQLNDHLKAEYKINHDLVTWFWNPSLYLDLKTIGQLKRSVPQVQRTVADRVMRIPGFASAATPTDLLAGAVPDNELGRRLLNSSHPTRTGNVLIAPAPFWFLYPGPEYGAAMHGGPHAYDTYVPIMVAGPGIPAKRVNRRVSPADLAPTVCNILQIKPPSGCCGNTLMEVLDAESTTTRRKDPG